MNNLLSTKEVAAILGVTESSIKRWTDSGLIQCVKTPGGHRKFTLDDVNIFARSNNYLISNSSIENLEIPQQQHLLFQIQKKEIHFICDHFYLLILSGNSIEIYNFIILMNLNGFSFLDFFDSVLQPSLTRMGFEWEAKIISVEDEHAASSAIFTALSRLTSSVFKNPKTDKVVILAVIEGDYHEIPVKCISLLLEMEGWSVRYLGANTPFYSLDSAVKKFKPEAVLISSTIRFNSYSDVFEKLISLKTYLKSYGGKLIVGGKGIVQKDLKFDLVDFWGSDFKSTIKYLNTLNNKP